MGSSYGALSLSLDGGRTPGSFCTVNIAIVMRTEQKTEKRKGKEKNSFYSVQRERDRVPMTLPWKEKRKNHGLVG